MKTRVLLCDFDGTLIQGNIENQFTRYLLGRKDIRLKLAAVAALTLPLNLLLHQLNRPSLLKSWTFILRGGADAAMDAFLDENMSRLPLRRDTLRLLSTLRYDKAIVLTGSAERLVQKYLERCSELSFDTVIGSCVKADFLTVERHPYGKGKMPFVDASCYNIGVADSESDRFYMNLCNETYFV